MARATMKHRKSTASRAKEKEVRSRRHSEHSDLDTRAHEILDSNPAQLTSKDIDAVLWLMKTQSRRESSAVLRIGHCAYLIYQCVEKKTLGELRRVFRKRTGMEYAAAMELRKFYEVYKDDPGEVDDYGLTAAKLLTRLPSRTKRVRLWKETGSVAELRAHFRKLKQTGNDDENESEGVALIDSPQYVEVKGGYGIRYYEGSIDIQLDTDGISLKKLCQRASKMLGVQIRITGM